MDYEGCRCLQPCRKGGPAGGNVSGRVFGWAGGSQSFAARRRLHQPAEQEKLREGFDRPPHSHGVLDNAATLVIGYRRRNYPEDHHYWYAYDDVHTHPLLSRQICGGTVGKGRHLLEFKLLGRFDFNGLFLPIVELLGPVGSRYVKEREILGHSPKPVLRFSVLYLVF